LTCNYNHIGVLVADIEAATGDFSRLLGISFLQPIMHHSSMVWHGVKLEHDLRITYSTEAPYIELIEGHSSGYFSLEKGEGFHHIGLWSPDYRSPAWLDRFGQLKIEVELPLGGEAVTALADPASCHGVRFELQDGRIRGAMESWLKGSALKL
jgi:hypothetical protein